MEEEDNVFVLNPIDVCYMKGMKITLVAYIALMVLNFLDFLDTTMNCDLNLFVGRALAFSMFVLFVYLYRRYYLKLGFELHDLKATIFDLAQRKLVLEKKKCFLRHLTDDRLFFQGCIDDDPRPQCTMTIEFDEFDKVPSSIYAGWYSSYGGYRISIFCKAVDPHLRYSMSGTVEIIALGDDFELVKKWLDESKAGDDIEFIGGAFFLRN